MGNNESLMDRTQSKVSYLAQSLCHKCLDALGECSIAYSGATCQEIIEAAKKIIKKKGGEKRC